MELSELFVTYGNSATEEWENLVKLKSDYHIGPDFSLGPEAVKKQELNRFEEITLPDGETIDPAVIYRKTSNGFTLHVKQGAVQWNALWLTAFWLADRYSIGDEAHWGGMRHAGQTARALRPLEHPQALLLRSLDSPFRHFST